MVQDDFGSGSPFGVGLLGHLGKEPRHFFQDRVNQRFSSGKIEEHGRHRHPGSARDLSMVRGANTSARKDAYRKLKKHCAPLGFVEAMGASTSRRTTPID